MKTLREIRRANLEALIAEAGGQKALADRIGKDKNQVYQWGLPPESPASRNISDRTARLLEDAMNRKAGWMDHDNHAGEPVWRVSEDPPSMSQPVGLDVAKLADLLATVEAATEKAGVRLPARVKARLVASLYADKEASAAASAQAVQAALVSILATMETTNEPDAAR